MWAILSITLVFNILLLASHDFPIWQTIYEVLVPIPEYLYALLNTTLTVIILFLAKASPPNMRLVEKGE